MVQSVAHTLLKIACQVLKTGTPYTEPGTDFYTRRESPEQRRAYLERQLLMQRHRRPDGNRRAARQSPVSTGD